MCLCLIGVNRTMQKKLLPYNTKFGSRYKIPQYLICKKMHILMIINAQGKKPTKPENESSTLSMEMT